MRLIRNTLLNVSRLVGWPLLCTVALVTFAPDAFAQAAQGRVIPTDTYQVRIQAIELPAVTIDGTTVQLASGVLIFTPENRTITSASLPVDVVVRVEFNGFCQIKKMWLLADDEIIHRPWWQTMWSGSFQPPC